MVLPSGVSADDLRAVEDVVMDEVNVRALEIATGAAGFATRRASANFRVLGKKVGSRMKAAGAAIAAMTEAEMDALAATGAVTLVLDDGPLALTPDDVTVVTEGVPGWHVASDGGVTLALDTNRTPDLIAEGLAREVVNRVQQLRKRGGLDVSDRIDIAFEAGDALAAALDLHGDYVRNETLALSLRRASTSAIPADVDASPDAGEALLTDTFDIDGHALRLTLRRA